METAVLVVVLSLAGIWWIRSILRGKDCGCGQDADCQRRIGRGRNSR
jgi:hypothetical protein